MAQWAVLGLSLAGVAVVAAPAIFAAVYWARRARTAQQEARSAQQAIAELRGAMADLQREVEHQGRQLATRSEDDRAVLITGLGSEDERRDGRSAPSIVLRQTVSERVAATAESALASFLTRPSDSSGILRRVVDRSAVRLVALGFGVAYALRPEARDRIEFASRAGMRRSRRQREHEVRLARRLVRSGRVVVSEER